MSWLTFLPFRVVGEYIQFTPLADSLAASGGGWSRRCCCTSASCTWP
jgi:GlpG protein